MELHKKDIKLAGAGIKDADKILLMLHGRGGTAEDIISLANHFNISKSAHIIAPQAANNSWYPNSFMAPVNQNEPLLQSALNLLKKIIDDIQNENIKCDQVYIIGFSQGACLSLEFAAQNATLYGGVIAFTGGLIGDVLNEKSYAGDFKNTKIFTGNSDRDPDVPFRRSEQSKLILERLGAEVTLKIYPGMAYTINEDEIDWVNKNIFLEAGNYK